MSFSERAYATLDFLRFRKRNYQLAFGSPAGEAVLKDLAVFCRATQTVYHKQPRLTDILIGRQEVWLRIQQHLNLTSEQLMKMYAPNVGESDD